MGVALLALGGLVPQMVKLPLAAGQGLACVLLVQAGMAVKPLSGGLGAGTRWVLGLALLATGIAAFALGSDTVGATLVLVGAGSMLAASLVLLLSSPDKAAAAVKQGTLPLLALLGDALPGDSLVLFRLPSILITLAGILLSALIARELGGGTEAERYVAQHLTPRYDPWDQRFCVVPDNDLFLAIKDGQHIYGRAPHDTASADNERQSLIDALDGRRVDLVVAGHVPGVGALGVVVDLERGERGAAVEPPELRRSDGASVYTVAGSQLFTSTAILEAEQRLVAAGRASWITTQWALPIPAELAATIAADEAAGATVTVVAWDGQVRGAISVADTIKPTSREAVARLRELGLTPILLTGDNPGAARAIANQAGIEDVRAGVTPQGKLDTIRDLQAAGRVVAMVGDGVNDAAALAAADLGIAMGTGTDAAITAADLTIVSGDLMLVPDAIRLARRTLGTIKGNLFWAFAYNVAAIPVAMLALLNPILAAAAMAFSSVFVVTNSLRLRRFTTTANNQTPAPATGTTPPRTPAATTR